MIVLLLPACKGSTITYLRRTVNYFLEIIDLTRLNCTKAFDTAPHVKPATAITKMSRKTMHY